MAQERDVSAPQLPCTPNTALNVARMEMRLQNFIQRIYFKGLDLLIETISRRFDRPEACQCLENLLVNATNAAH